MKEISVANDIVPLGEFKADLSKWLNNVQQTGQAVVVTQNGRPAGVLLSPKEFDHLRHTKLFTRSIAQGLADADAGRVLSTSELKTELEKRRRTRAAK